MSALFANEVGLAHKLGDLPVFGGGVLAAIHDHQHHICIYQ